MSTPSREGSYVTKPFRRSLTLSDPEECCRIHTSPSSAFESEYSSEEEEVEHNEEPRTSLEAWNNLVTTAKLAFILFIPFIARQLGVYASRFGNLYL